MKAKEAWLIAYLVGGVSLGVYVDLSRETKHPESEGAAYLQKQGYSHVTGGAIAVFNSCGGYHALARAYKVQDAHGQQVEKTVCFDVLGSPPIFSY